MQQIGTMVVPCKDTVTWASALGFAQSIQDVTMPAWRERVLMNPVQIGTNAPSGGPTGLVSDIAILTFKGAGPYGLKVALLGPGNIFTSDTVTVDVTNPHIASIIAWIIANGTDKVGNSLTSYSSGRRIA